MRKLAAPLVGVLVVLALATSPATAAKPPPPTTSPPPPTTAFTIDPRGVFTSPATANISGLAQCVGGTGTLTFDNPPGTPYLIAGTTSVVCDGQPHQWAATITSPSGSFRPGGFYLIRGVLTSPGGTASGIGKVYLV